MIEFKLEGMTCGHCVAAVTRAAKEVDAAAGVQVDLAGGRVQVDSAVGVDAFARAFGEAGYPAAVVSTVAAAAVAPAVRTGGCCCGGARKGGACGSAD